MASFIRSNILLVVLTASLCLSLVVMIVLYFTVQFAHYSIEVDVGIMTMIIQSIFVAFFSIKLINNFRSFKRSQMAPKVQLPAPIQRIVPEKKYFDDDDGDSDLRNDYSINSI